MDARFSPETIRAARRWLLPALLTVALAGPRGPLLAEGRAAVEDRRVAEQARLEKIRAEIDDLRDRLARTEATAGSVLDAIEELDLRVALLGREAESLRQEAREAQAREAETRRQADLLEQRIASSERDLRGFLREIYKVGPTRYLRVVAASSSPAQFASGQRASEALSLGEARRIDDYRADRVKLDAVLSDLSRQRDEIARLDRELLAKDQELRDSRRRKEAVLAGLRHQEAAQKRTLLEMNTMQEQVQKLLERLSHPESEGPVPSLGFARFRGRMAWPARGRLAIPFGKVRHPRFSTVVPHPGIDIAAAPGQEVHAIFDGRVVFSDWFKGYGEMVVIEHGDGYLSIYGHVSERLVTVGQEVRQGERIARSGEGGSFDTPGLYFEIRHDGKAEDPVPWLRGSAGRTAAGPSVRRGARASRGNP